MNELKYLESLGLTLPSPAYVAGAIIFGILGYVSFRRGRKVSRPALTWVGIALMIYPYAVPQTWLLWVVGVGLGSFVILNWN